MPKEVYIVAVLLGHALRSGIGPSKDMLPPLLIVEGNQFNPLFEIVIFTLDNALLPLFVVSDVVVGVETIVAMVTSHFIALWLIVCLKSMLGGCLGGRE